MSLQLVTVNANKTIVFDSDISDVFLVEADIEISGKTLTISERIEYDKVTIQLLRLCNNFSEIIYIFCKISRK